MNFDDHEIQPKLNRHVTRLMHEWGSDFKKLHQIDHFFYSDSKPGAEALVSWAKNCGFDVSDIHDRDEREDAGVPRYSFNITIPAKPDGEQLDRQTNQMLRLASEYECDYDGWGTLIEE